MDRKTQKHIERKKQEFATFNILSVMKSVGRAMEHEDLVSRVLVQDGCHEVFESPEEYQRYVLVGIVRLYDRGILSVKLRDDGYRYGLMPRNRPEKKKAEYGKD